ncbi:hypothetical protein Ahp2_53 [Aeromonas phage Ahp2]|nr:hypothetical protein Ahp2_53 [Aeromonas phage Ahp2]
MNLLRGVEQLLRAGAVITDNYHLGIHQREGASLAHCFQYSLTGISFHVDLHWSVVIVKNSPVKVLEYHPQLVLGMRHIAELLKNIVR